MKDFDLYILFFSSAIFFCCLSGGIVYFIILYQKKQTINKLEQERLHSQFQQELIKTQLEIQEQTMQTIGADLHDNIGQLLSLTSLTLHSIEIENRLKSQQKIEAAIDLTLRSIKEMRLLGKLLQGDQLIVLGLSEAIRHQVSWLERAGHYVVTYLQESEMPAVSNPNIDLILFRLLQEVLNNIIKHARATSITIKLDYLEKAIFLKIEDNGMGFSLNELPAGKKGMGLQNINKRATIVGGEVNITSKPGEGTVILIFIPYP